MKIKTIIPILISIILIRSVFADDGTKVDSTEVKLETWRVVTSGAFSVGALYYSSQRFKEAWGASDRADWHYKTDDWIGDGLAQNDEVSHFIAGQRVTQLGRSLALWTGFDDKTSTIFGAAVSLGIVIWVEILDAYNPAQGFGTSDLIIGTAGVAFELARIKYPIAKRFDIRVSFQQVKNISPNLIVAECGEHYDNAIYWLTYKPDEELPFDIAFGYSTSHSFEIETFLKPKREFFIGIGISGQELMKLFDKDMSNFISGIGAWYEFTLYAKVYESEPVDF